MTVTARAENAASPEVGQLVRVRDRHWVVTEAYGPSSQVDELAGEAVQHLVELASVEVVLACW
jgi:hypothetical protein